MKNSRMVNHELRIMNMNKSSIIVSMIHNSLFMIQLPQEDFTV